MCNVVCICTCIFFANLASCIRVPRILEQEFQGFHISSLGSNMDGSHFVLHLTINTHFKQLHES